MRKKVIIIVIVLFVIAGSVFVAHHIDLIGILKRMHGG